MAKRTRRSRSTAAVAASSSPRPQSAATKAPGSDIWTDRSPSYWPVVGVVLALALGLRVYYLAPPIFQADEAIYSIFSNNFQDYNFDPVYHGPALYHVVKLFFLLFGDTDFTARFVSVVAAMITLGLLIGPARRWLGARGALGAVAVIAISPVMVTYQRRIFFDSWVVMLTLASVVCFQSAITIKPGTWRWRWTWIGLSTLLVVFLASKANAFFVIAMIASFWVLTRVRNVGPRNLLVKLPAQLPLILLMIFFAAIVLLAERDGNVARKERILWIIGVTCCGILWEWLRRPAADQRRTGDEPRGIQWPRPDLVAILIAAAIGAFLYAFLFGHGYLWWRDPRHAIQQHWPEIRDAMKKMLDYWGGQQKQPRLPSRHDFYVPLMLLYELPLVVASLCGIYRACRRRTRFTDFLLWWTFTSFVLYSLANEKVPWLMIHVVLPFAVMGGWWLGQVRFSKAWARQAFAVGCVLGAAYLLRNVSATNYERAVDHHEPMFYSAATESFNDVFKTMIAKAHEGEGDMWIYNAWPTSWYLRHADREFPGVAIFYDENYIERPNKYRLVMCTEQEWDKYKSTVFAGFHRWIYDPARDEVVKDGVGENPYILIWPRITWSALRPDKWAHWWVTREATRPDQPDIVTDPFLVEWSHQPVVFATPQ